MSIENIEKFIEEVNGLIKKYNIETIYLSGYDCEGIDIQLRDSRTIYSLDFDINEPVLKLEQVFD